MLAVLLATRHEGDCIGSADISRSAGIFRGEDAMHDAITFGVLIKLHQEGRVHRANAKSRGSGESGRSRALSMTLSMTGRSDTGPGSWPPHCPETDFAFALDGYNDANKQTFTAAAGNSLTVSCPVSRRCELGRVDIRHPVAMESADYHRGPTGFPFHRPSAMSHRTLRRSSIRSEVAGHIAAGCPCRKRPRSAGDPVWTLGS